MLSLVWPVASLGVILAMAQEAMTAAARVLEIFDTMPDIVSGSATAPEPRGHLRFEHVDFTYPGSDTLVLRDVNLDLAPGRDRRPGRRHRLRQDLADRPGPPALRRDRRPDDHRRRRRPRATP